ncbi:VWD domain-containing protein [Deinococcus roseus]|uniref:VWFD domain-containing protein n=1 Tax=Deinococcus roseus TaxID=392414 RepID=A0ABQ2D3N2_9DEIO|nr:VWD domain-containing protein [Deinococcus roseus]GGJ44931.1 hypothetical protein GCM10008938_33970 [Deinococcus roseus]
MQKPGALLLGLTVLLTACSQSLPTLNAPQSQAVFQEQVPLPIETRSLLVSPAGATLRPMDRYVTLTVEVFDSNVEGRKQPFSEELEWISTPNLQVIPSKGGLSATVKSLNGNGGFVYARGKTSRKLLSNPVTITVAEPTAGTVTLRDSQIVYPLPIIPVGATAQTYPLKHLDPKAGMIGTFTQQEVGDAYRVPSGSPKPEGVLEIPIVVYGTPPKVGERVLGLEGKAVMGTVLSVQTRGDYSLVRLRRGLVTEYLKSVRFSVKPEDTRGDEWQTVMFGNQASANQNTIQKTGAMDNCTLTVSQGSIEPTFTPIFSFSPDVDLVIEDDTIKALGFFLDGNIGVDASILAKAKVTAKVSCTLFDDKKVFPIFGLVSVLLAPAAKYGAKIDLSVNGEVGTQIKLNLRAEAPFHFGSGLGSDPRFTNTLDPKLTGSIDLMNNPTQVSVGTELYGYGYARGILQVGGVVVGAIENFFPSLAKKLGSITEVLELEVIDAKIGPVGKLNWANDAYVTEHEMTPSTAVIQGELRAKVQMDEELNTFLSKIGLKKIGSYEFTPLVILPQPLYAAPEKDTLSVLLNGSPVNASPLTVKVGDTLVLKGQAKIPKFSDVRWFNVYAGTGSVWLNPNSVLYPSERLTGVTASAGTQQAAFLTSQTISITQELCDRINSNARITLLSENKMFDQVPTSGFAGSVQVNCDGQPPQPPTPPAPPPPAGTGGDPHLKTQDGTLYDLQNVGEFVLTRDPLDAAGFEIQVRTQAGQAPSVVSYNQAFAFRVNGDRVGIYPDGIKVNGLPVPQGTEALHLPHGGYLSIEQFAGFTPNRLSVHWPDGSYARLIGDDLRVVPSGSRAARLVGLLGNRNNDTSDDFKLPNGTVLGQPSAQDIHRVFGHAWRIGQQESLFDYAEGQTTADFTDVNFPQEIVTFENLSAERKAYARGICLRAPEPILPAEVLNSCIYDVALNPDSASQRISDPYREPYLQQNFLAVFPRTLELEPGRTVQLTAQALSATGLSWSASAGTIAGTGLQVTYTAPTTPGTYTLTATRNGFAVNVPVQVKTCASYWCYLGTASESPDGKMVLTPGTSNQEVGAVYSSVPLDLSRPFTQKFRFDVGEDMYASCGLAYAWMTQRPQTLGTTGCGLGVDGLPEGVMAFEVFTGSGSHGDSLYIKVLADPNIFGPSRLLNFFLSDGQEHTLDISWNPSTRTIKGIVDAGLPRMQTLEWSVPQSINLPGKVYAGFSSGTSLSATRHDVIPLP